MFVACVRVKRYVVLLFVLGVLTFGSVLRPVLADACVAAPPGAPDTDRLARGLSRLPSRRRHHTFAEGAAEQPSRSFDRSRTRARPLAVCSRPCIRCLASCLSASPRLGPFGHTTEHAAFTPPLSPNFSRLPLQPPLIRSIARRGGVDRRRRIPPSARCPRGGCSPLRVAPKATSQSASRGASRSSSAGSAAAARRPRAQRASRPPTTTTCPPSPPPLEQHTGMSRRGGAGGDERWCFGRVHRLESRANPSRSATPPGFSRSALGDPPLASRSARRRHLV